MFSVFIAIVIKIGNPVKKHLQGLSLIHWGDCFTWHNRIAASGFCPVRSMKAQKKAA